HAVDAIRVVVGDIEAAVTPDREVDGPAEHALAVAPARRELLDPGGEPVTEADPDDLVPNGRQPGPRAVEGDEEIAEVLRGKLRSRVEGQAERGGMRRELQTRQRHRPAAACAVERRIAQEGAALGEALRPAVRRAVADLRH